MRCISVSIALLVLMAAAPSVTAQIPPVAEPVYPGGAGFEGFGIRGFSVPPVHFLRARPYIFSTFIVRPRPSSVQRIYALRGARHRTRRH